MRNSTCVCGHPAEWHSEKLVKEGSPHDHGPNCIGGRCGCSGLKELPAYPPINYQVDAADVGADPPGLTDEQPPWRLARQWEALDG